MNRRLRDASFTGFAWAAAAALLAAVGSILGFLFVRGAGVLDLALIFGDADPIAALTLRAPVFDGLFPAMVGTFLLVVLSVFLAVPAGLAAGIYMAEYAAGPVRGLLGLFFDILAGIPSIVVGLFGFSAAIFLHHLFSDRIYPCLLISALSLAFLVLPYLIRTTQVAIEEIPAGVRLTAPALGATRFQNIAHVLVPRALSGILSGVILAIGRCAEDTAVIMLTGVVATAGVPRSLFSSYEALPFYIYTVSAQYADTRELATGYGAAVVLLIICALLFVFAYLLKHFLSRRAGVRV